jgi:anti-repressor protein
MEELVFKSAKGNPVTTSLLVAIKFGKEHKDVIRAIKNLINSAQNCAHFYYSTTYTDSRNRHQEMFIMNRDGFSLLVMGFTGPEALQFKLDFIVAFNKMEQQLKSLAILPNFKNPVEAARAWADAEEKRQIAA